MNHVLVTGAGGFIGGHLVRRLREDGVRSVRAVDCKPLDEWYQVFDDVENVARRPAAARRLPRGRRRRRHGVQPGRRHGRHGLHREQQGPVHAVGARHHAHARGRPRGRRRALLLLVVGLRVRRRASRRRPRSSPLREADAYPAMPEDGYGWEKLFSERMCPPLPRGLRPRRPASARYHNVYGPDGTCDGGREKAPAAICRKVADGQAHRRPRRSRSGATASRPAASPTSTTASRARSG